MKYTLAPIAAALFLLSGCDNAQNASPQQMTQEVGVVTLQGQPVPVVSSLTGRTTASLSAEVRPQVGGIVQKRLFTEGDMVKAGQALYQIDPSSYRATFNEAAASLKQAQALVIADCQKAQRYAVLVKDNGVSRQDADDAIATCNQDKASVESKKAALESALAHWLYHDELLNRGNAKAKAEILHAIARVRHALVLFGGIVPRKATTLLRERLNEAETALAEAETAQAALFSVATVRAKLTLTDLLVNRGWRPFLNAAGEQKIAGSFKRFADIQLSRAAAELKNAFRQPSADGYVDQLPRLTREIDTVQLLSGAYLDVAGPWLENWQETRRAIAHNDSSVIEYFRRQALAAEPFWLHSGKR